MPDISGLSLAVLVGLMNREMTALQNQVDALYEQGTDEAEEQASHLEDLMLRYSKVEMELENAYEQARTEPGHLPTYDEVVKQYSQ